MSQDLYSTRRVIANVAKGCLGNTIEWYDWFVYASFSIYFSKVFFPEGNQTAQLLSTAVIFAVGFLMRPLGGWLLGMYADKFGRRNALALSVMLMSGGSLLIGLTPGFESIGVFAPVLLVVARLAQGLSVGGEFGSSATYLSEIAPPGRRGVFSSFQYVSIILGQLLALVVMIIMQQTLSAADMLSWGWRVPFFIGAVVGLTVMILRRTMDESEHYEREVTKRKVNPTTAEGGNLKTLMKYKRQFMAALLLALGGTVCFYVYTSYMQKFMVNTAGIAKEDASVISFWALFFLMLLQPLVGWLSDKVGRRKVMIGFGIGATLTTVPVLTLLGKTSNPLAAFGIMAGCMVILSGYTSCAAIIKAEMFPTSVRALGVGIPHALVAAIFSGTVEPIALWLKQIGHEPVFFWYVTACAALTLVAAIAIPDPSKNSLLESELESKVAMPASKIPSGH